MSNKLIVANWKMNGTTDSIKLLLNEIITNLNDLDAEVSFCAPYIYLNLVKDILKTKYSFGAQNVHTEASGAFTGEISANMLQDIGCKYVILGHSERRTIFKENDATIFAKLKATLAANLSPILCIGETKEQREQDQTFTVIKKQLEKVLTLNLPSLTIAYEPVWAIGTGLSATPDQADEVHKFIKEQFDPSMDLRILYGGSVNAKNAKSLFEQPNIDGGLIGGASLKAPDFTEICLSTHKEVKI